MKTFKHLLFASFLIILTSGILPAQINWTKMTSPTASNLHGIAFINQNTWVAVGDGGTILRSTDGGTTWSIISSPVGDPLQAVSFFGNTGIAVGISGRILRSTDGGITWTKLAKLTSKNLYAVSINSKTAVITGEEGTIMHSTDQGVTWSFATAGTASILFGNSAFGDSVIAAGGAGAVVMSLSGGSSWGLTILGDLNTFFYGAALPNGVTGYIVGVNTSSGLILRTDNTGFTWALQTSGTTNQLYGVSFTSVDTGAVVGTAGTILYTSNGGSAWIPQTSGTTNNLNGIALIHSAQGMAVGDGGIILRASSQCVQATVTPSGNISACQGSLPVLTANGGSGISYQWFKNSKVIAGATNQTYTPNKTASYFVNETTISGCNSNSNVVNVTIFSQPPATITPLGNLDICTTGSVDLQANAGTGLTYQWEKGTSTISGATNQIYTATKKGTYKVIVTNANNCSKTSAGVKVISSCREENSIANSSALNCYPNPSDGEFTLNLTLANGQPCIATIDILNSVGQKIVSEKVPVTLELKKTMNLNQYNEGVYTIHVIAGNENLQYRLMIQK